MFKKFLVRLKNRKVLAATVSGILLILVNTGVIDAHMSDNIFKAFNTVLSFLVGMGVFANPESHVEDQA
ncbi:hypothetical protein [Priestia megaterium]|uniref:hypothetical protein n=1 Tax=Priestia megaterium TaxID=1404 RepID=UPI000BEC25ED|nr:hypothetical protein [Priestia megaterium]PED63960.1 hypothetical protein CON20_23620 [Priestia megaterium]